MDFEALERMEFEVLERRKEVLGDRHPVAWGMHNLGVMWHALKRYDEAEDVMKEVVELRKEMVGENNRFTLGSIQAPASCKKSADNERHRVHRMHKQT